MKLREFIEERIDDGEMYHISSGVSFWYIGQFTAITADKVESISKHFIDMNIKKVNDYKNVLLKFDERMPEWIDMAIDLDKLSGSERTYNEIIKRLEFLHKSIEKALSDHAGRINYINSFVPLLEREVTEFYRRIQKDGYVVCVEESEGRTEKGNYWMISESGDMGKEKK